MIGGYIGSPIGGIVVLAENTITAIATITEASDTLTAASKVQIRASASLTEANDTLTAAGQTRLTVLGARRRGEVTGNSRMMANATGSARLQGRPTGNTRIRGYI